MDVQHVIRLLEIANNDLPLVEHKCERLKREVDDLEANKHNSARILQEISDQITYLRKICKEQRLELTKIQLQKVRLEGLVDSFQNNDEGYVKIRNTVEEKVVSILSDKKTLLKLALLSLTDSMKNDPDRYSRLVYHNTPSTANYNSQDYDTASYGQQQQYPSHAYTDMLLKEAEKLYSKLTKELGDEIISDYAPSTSTSLLQLLPQLEERQSDPAANQTHMHRIT
jgi:hypothetical protein